jgi:hypothetical protein
MSLADFVVILELPGLGLHVEFECQAEYEY